MGKTPAGSAPVGTTLDGCLAPLKREHQGGQYRTAVLRLVTPLRLRSTTCGADMYGYWYALRDIFLLESLVVALSICMAKFSRKKFQEALRALKQVCKNDRLPATLRVRAAELILAVYGVPLPESSVRIKRTVRELVQEGGFDREVRNQVNERIRQDAEAEARKFLETVKAQPTGGQ